MHPIDERALEADLDALRAALRAEAGPEDLTHLRRMARWGRMCSLVGLVAAGFFPNPLAWFGLGLGNFARWAIVAHHVIHRGLDKLPGTPRHLHGRVFARGWRRLIDWFDWMHPDAWHHEHDVLHHYRVGVGAAVARPGDPDVAEDNAFFLRDSNLPSWARRAVVYLGSLVWKPLYYAPNTLNHLLDHDARRTTGERVSIFSWDAWLPWRPRARAALLRCWLPYAAWRFGALPALFLLWSPTAALYALINLLIAEAVANAWSFWVIVPNHTGDDLYRFDGPVRGRGDFYLRQIVGSTNYRTGGDLNDFLHGWLNYQIEHHVFPDLSPRQYQRAQPRLKALCEKHGVPYVQESIFTRMRKTTDILIGATSMRRWPPTEAAEAA